MGGWVGARQQLVAGEECRKRVVAEVVELHELERGTAFRNDGERRRQRLWARAHEVKARHLARGPVEDWRHPESAQNFVVKLCARRRTHGARR